MQEQINKIKTYVGFAIKSKQILYGTDDILKSKKVNLIIISKSLAQSSENKLKNYANSKKIEIFSIDDNIFKTIIISDVVKAFAITNQELANAVTNQLIGGYLE